jgi:uncharacterized protein YjbI with pentapeptide repeats
MSTPPVDERRPPRRPIIWLAAFGIIGWLVFTLTSVLIIPRLLHPPLPASKLRELTVNQQLQRQQEQRKLQNEVRTTLVQGSVGLLALAGAYVAWRQLQETRRHQQQDEALTREGQVTERFTQAVEQLGGDKLELRLGGIYALERLAKDSNVDQVAIAEILSAYVCSRAPCPPSQPGQFVKDASLDEVPSLRARAADVQAAMTVLGKAELWADIKPRDLPIAELWTDIKRLRLPSVDLRKAYLRGADLTFADLQDADLRGADLRGADLTFADLQDADLRGADLRFADLKKTNLRGAHLQGTDLQGAYLYKLGPEGPNLQGANLQGAKLQSSHLEGANLKDKDLRETNLQGAHLEKANLRNVDLGKANLQKAHLQGADLWAANLQKADLREANLRGTLLWQADLQDALLQGAEENTDTLWPDAFNEDQRRQTGIHTAS